MNPVSQELGPCPCETEYVVPGSTAARRIRSCGVVGTKLTKYGHLVGCTCRSCMGRRNKRKGRASEARAWKHLGGEGVTRNDDSPHRWDLSVQMENKSGQQIPQHFLAFVASKWLDDAMFQAVKKTPVGDDSYPAIRLELTPSRAYLLVDISPRKKVGPE